MLAILYFLCMRLWISWLSVVVLVMAVNVAVLAVSVEVAVAVDPTQ